MRLLPLSLILLLLIPNVYADTGTATSTLTIDPAASSGTTITAADENDRNNDMSTHSNAHVHSLSNTTLWGDGAAGNKLFCADAANSSDSCIRWEDTAKLWQVDNPTGTFGQIVTSTGTSGLTAKALLIGNATSSILPLTDGLGSSGQFLQSQGGGSEPQWAEQAAGLILVGSNTTEVTDNSGNDANFVVISSLNISAATPILIVANLRKTSGAAASPQIGLTVNSTEVIAPASATTWGSGSDTADQNMFVVFIGPRVTLYTGSLVAMTGGSIEGFGGKFHASIANMPTVAITSITIRGNSGSASITMGVDEVYVYTLSTS